MLDGFPEFLESVFAGLAGLEMFFYLSFVL